MIPAVDGHFFMVDWWRREAKRRFDIDFSVAVLEYSSSSHIHQKHISLAKLSSGLVTHAPWPIQLRQVVAALQHLINQGYDTPEVFLTLSAAELKEDVPGLVNASYRKLTGKAKGWVRELRKRRKENEEDDGDEEAAAAEAG